MVKFRCVSSSSGVSGFARSGRADLGDSERCVVLLRRHVLRRRCLAGEVDGSDKLVSGCGYQIRVLRRHGRRRSLNWRSFHAWNFRFRYQKKPCGHDASGAVSIVVGRRFTWRVSAGVNRQDACICCSVIDVLLDDLGNLTPDGRGQMFWAAIPACDGVGRQSIVGICWALGLRVQLIIFLNAGLARIMTIGHNLLRTTSGYVIGPGAWWCEGWWGAAWALPPMLSSVLLSPACQ